MELGVPKKAYFQAYIIHCHGPMVFVVRKAKRGALIANVRGPWQKDAIYD